MIVAVPLALPAMAALGLDLVWMGVLTVLAVEVGLLTPPLGIAVYVIHGALRAEDIPLRDIFIGAAPFAVTMTISLRMSSRSRSDVIALLISMRALINLSCFSGCVFSISLSFIN